MTNHTKIYITLLLITTTCLLASGCGKLVGEKEISAEFGSIVTYASNGDSWFDLNYIIQSSEELDSFLAYMQDDMLEENAAFSTLDFTKETLLIVLADRTSSDYQYHCDKLTLKENQLQLSYSREGNGYTCDVINFYLYAIVPNSELTEAYYEGWVKPSEALVEDRIHASLGVIKTGKAPKNWKAGYQYMIQSNEELALFLKCMNDNKLKKNKIFSEMKLDLETLLIVPIEDANECHYICNALVLDEEKLTLEHSVVGESNSEDKVRYYLYALVDNNKLMAENYDGWARPSEVFTQE